MATPPEISDELMEALRKLNRTILEDLERNTLFGAFNTWNQQHQQEVHIPEDGFKQRTGTYQGGWATPGKTYSIDVCTKCGEPLKFHKDKKCPVIIDAKFKEEPKPQLPSGKEKPT